MEGAGIVKMFCPSLCTVPMMFVKKVSWCWQMPSGPEYL